MRVTAVSCLSSHPTFFFPPIPRMHPINMHLFGRQKKSFKCNWALSHINLLMSRRGKVKCASTQSNDKQRIPAQHNHTENSTNSHEKKTKETSATGNGAGYRCAGQEKLHKSFNTWRHLNGENHMIKLDDQQWPQVQIHRHYY